MLAIIPGVIAFILGTMLARKITPLTQKGVEEKEQWNGLKNYMKDFSLLKEREVPELVLWEKYLVYATVFGIADKVLKQIKVKYKEFADEDYMRNTAYLYMVSRSNMDTAFMKSINNSVSKAYSSVYSSSGGSGGGFSGGGRRTVGGGGSFGGR